MSIYLKTLFVYLKLVSAFFLIFFYFSSYAKPEKKQSISGAVPQYKIGEVHNPSNDNSLDSPCDTESKLNKTIQDSNRLLGLGVCQKDDLNLSKIIKAKLKSIDIQNRKGEVVLFETPYIKFVLTFYSDGSSTLGVFKQEVTEDNASGGNSISQFTLFLDSNFDLQFDSRSDPRKIPLAQKSQNDCLVDFFVRKGLISPVIPEPEKVKLYDDVFLTRGNNLNNSENLISREKYRENKSIKNAGMFQIVVSDETNNLIGTYGLAVCVGVSIWHPENKKAAVIHFDPQQDVHSNIDKMVESLGGNSTVMEARIVGGWEKYSERTVYHVRKKLGEYGIKIVQEDTMGDGSRRGKLDRGFAIDARSGELIGQYKRATSAELD